MKIAIIGYGKMGRTIERVASKRGHEIVCIIDVNNTEDLNSEAFKSADVAIEFTAPDIAVANFRAAWKAGVAVVSGTTGWTSQLPEVKNEIEQNGYALFWSSNFSLGVNIMMEVNRYLAKIMSRYPDYKISITEVHHAQKLDSPSGTAITLAEDIIANTDREITWITSPDTLLDQLVIHSVREGQIPGIHTVSYESIEDTIEITHNTKNREGLAMGAVLAAEFTCNKKGLFGMADMMKF